MTFHDPRAAWSDPSKEAVAPSAAMTPRAPGPAVAPTTGHAGPQAAPGWYAEHDNPGVLRYWNGIRWEDWRRPLVEAPTVDQGQKSTGLAYVLAIFVGGLGIHNFYLGRTGPAVGMLVIWLLGILTSVFFVGTLLLFAVGVWLIVDLFLIPGYVRAANLRAVGRGIRA